MSDPRISIVTPSFNQARYLEQTLRSVLDQDYPDLEYIVMDGGSTDGSVDLIRSCASRLAYWTSGRDRGQTDAINQGLARATGDILGWLNSDDVYLPGTLHRIARAFREARDADVVYGDYELITPDGRPFLRRREIPFDWYCLLYGVNFIGQPSSFFTRAAWQRFGPMDESLRYSMDYDFYLRIGHGGGRFQLVPECLSQYRYHPQSKTVGEQGAFESELDQVRARYRPPGARGPLRLHNVVARARRQVLKLTHRHTLDWLGGPLGRLRYGWLTR